MPIKTILDLDNNLTIFHCSGVVRTDVLMRVIKSFHDGEPTLNTLYDLTNFSVDHLGYKDLSGWCDFLMHKVNFEQRIGGRAAIVAPTDIQYGIARIVESLLSLRAPHEIRVFRSVSDAVKWIRETSNQVVEHFSEKS